MSRQPAAFAALALLAVVSAVVHSADACETIYDYSSSRSGEHGALQNANLTRQFRRVLRCDGAPAFKLLLHLWTPRVVEMDCSSFASVSWECMP